MGNIFDNEEIKMATEDEIVDEFKDIERFDEEATLMLMMSMVALGRVNKPYKKVMSLLKTAFDQNPEMRRAVRECFQNMVEA